MKWYKNILQWGTKIIVIPCWVGAEQSIKLHIVSREEFKYAVGGIQPLYYR